MNTDNLRGADYFATDAGQANIGQQVHLETNSAIQAGKRRRDLVNDLFEVDENDRLKFSKNKIAGSDADLGRRFDSILSSSGGKGGNNRYHTVREMRNIRADKVGMDAANTTGWERYKRTSLGIDSEMLKHASTSAKGGIGQDNMYQASLTKGWAQAGALQHGRRALEFAAGRGMGRDILNTVGLMTKHQKELMRSPHVSVSSKLMMAGGAAAGAIYSASIAGDYLSGRKESTLTDNAATAVATSALAIGAGGLAFRTSKELTHAATSLIPKGISKGMIGKYKGPGAGFVDGGIKLASKARPYMKMGLGATVGVGAFLGAQTLVEAAGEILRSSASMDNSINRLKTKIYKGDYTGDTSVNTNQLQTQRQRVLNKLSKSGLNDRATLLGNEAMILKGLL